MLRLATKAQLLIHYQAHKSVGQDRSYLVGLLLFLPLAEILSGEADVELAAGVCSAAEGRVCVSGTACSHASVETSRTCRKS